MTPNVMLAHLYALRAQIDAVIVAAELDAGAQQQAAAKEPGNCPNCGAPPDKVEDRSTLDGTKRDYCTSCGYEWERFAAATV